MENSMPLIKEFIIPNPPTYWDLVFKKQKFDKDGKLITHTRFYLTANLFYADRTSFHLTQKIVNDCKMFLFEKVKGLPELEKLRLELEYHHTKDIDLDNKLYFWVKLLLDIFKTPTARQIEKAKKYKKAIITTNTIYDDTTKQIDDISMKFKKGEHKMIIRIFGIVKSEQKTLDLFFIN